MFITIHRAYSIDGTLDGFYEPDAASSLGDFGGNSSGGGNPGGEPRGGSGGSGR